MYFPFMPECSFCACCCKPLFSDSISGLEDNEENEFHFTTETVQCACAEMENYFQFPSEFVSFLKILLGRDFVKFVCQKLGHLVHVPWHCLRSVGRPIVMEGESCEQNGGGPSGTVDTAGP